MYKKNIVMIPSAWSHKALGDISNFVEYYRNDFDIVIISDKYEEEIIEIENVKYVKAKTYLADYYSFTSEYVIDAGTKNRKSKITKNQKCISVWHGIPYKNMFVDFEKKNLYTALNYSNAYDCMISPSKYYSEKFLQQSMKYNGEIIEIGSSRTDKLFKTKEEIESIKEKYNIQNKKVFLYAPTYREKGKTDINLDLKKVLKILGDEYAICIKLHYLNYTKNKPKFVVDLSEEETNNVLSITDILITDYSSLIFDYSVLSKKIILFQYDYDKYNNERGFMFDMKDFIDEKYICKTEEEVYNILKTDFNTNLSKMKKIFYPHEDGKSTQRIVDRLAFIPEVRKEKEIIFLVNDLNQIGGVHNFLINLGTELKKKYNCRLILIAINEFNTTNEDFIRFDREDLFYITLSKQLHGKACRQILKGTEGIIISLQFSAHIAFQEYLEEKRTILMFHGDVKDIINKTLYKWHLDAINNRKIYNYNKLLFLTKSNVERIVPYLDKNLVKYVDYIENSFEFNFKNLYQKSNVYVAVTRLDKDKNIFDILNIFKHNKLDSDKIIHIYGDGPLKNKFETKIKEAGLENKIILKGYCKNKEVMFKDKQGYITTSKSEGFHLAFLEAINFGIPIYAFNGPSAFEEIVSPQIGVLIQQGDFDKFVQIINENREFNFQKMQEIASKFSNENIIKKWCNLISEIKITDKVKKGKKFHQEELKIKYIEKYKKKYRKMNMKKKLFIRNTYDNISEKRKLKKLRELERKESPLVSIIIPFYNNGDVIEKAIVSIKKQKYSNIEIILINDGSNYDERNLLRKYPFIKYIYKENEGLGKTRNFGMNKASGEFIYFLDSDDTLPVGAITSLVYFAEKNKLNLVAGKCVRIKYNDKYDRHIWFHSIYKNNYINKKNNREKLLKDTLSTNKLYRRKPLLDSKIVFESGLYEDKLFINKVYNYFDKIGIINNFVYNWYVYGGNTSITTTVTFANFLERYSRIKEIWNISSEKQKYVNYHFAINHDFKIYINSFNNFTEDEKSKFFEIIREFLNSNKQYYYSKNIINIINIEYLKACFENDYNRFKDLCEINSEIKELI